MKSKSYFFVAVLFLQLPLFAQTISLAETSVSCYDSPTILSLIGNDGGSPARNIYAGDAGNGDIVRVIWSSANNRWEMDYDQNANGVYEYVDFVNSFASAPNPPALGTGTWSTFSGTPCSSLAQFEGTGTQTALLPVEFISFNGNYVKNEVALNWVTASEVNNERFEIESSSNGKEFDKIGQVLGRGTSTARNSYSFMYTPNSVSEVLYYRLKQIDFDDQFEYSKVIRISTDLESGQLAIYPNPATSKVNISIAGGSIQDEVLITITDMMGKLVKSVYFMGGNMELDVAALTNGMYLISLSQGDRNTYSRLMIEK